MFNFVLLSIVIITQLTFAKSSFICTNSGDFNGSYILDITGYEKIINGQVKNQIKTLGFKPFRSWINPVAQLNCNKPNFFLEGPNALISCYSGPVKDYGSHNAVYEAILFKQNSQLTLSIRGPGISKDQNLPCKIIDN